MKFVDLFAGERVVEMNVSGNDNETISIEVGGDSVVYRSADSWMGRSLVRVGDESSQIPPGKTPVEIEVAEGAQWGISFVDPPAPMDPGESISGQGQDVRFVDLPAGSWVVEISISDNIRCSAISGRCSGASFDVDIGDYGVIYESVESWSGRKLLTAGDAYGEIRPGNAAIEVEAEPGATWMLMFTHSDELLASDSDEAILGRGTDVKSVDLPVGEKIVEMNISNNNNGTVSIKIGGDSVAYRSADSWTGRSLIRVGDESSQIPPGKTAAEIEASEEAQWEITFVDPPPPEDRK